MASSLDGTDRGRQTVSRDRLEPEGNREPGTETDGPQTARERSAHLPRIFAPDYELCVPPGVTYLGRTYDIRYAVYVGRTC